MYDLVDMTTGEIIVYVGVTVFSIVIASLKRFFPKLLESSWRKILTSRGTPSRLNSQEKHILKLGIKSQMKQVCEKMMAARIVLFQEKRNGTNSLKKLIDVYHAGKKGLQGFDGIATKRFERNFEDFRKNGYTHIHNTDDKNDYHPFSQFLKDLGVKSYDVYNIEGSSCAFLIIYENNTYSFEEHRPFAEMQLSACTDSIIELYDRQQ